MITTTITVAGEGGPATHYIPGTGRFRKGSTGMAELEAWGRWAVTDWKNDELDTCHWFFRVDGQPKHLFVEEEHEPE